LTLCEDCGKRPSMVHMTKIINGEKTELRLCELCAKNIDEFIPVVTNSFSIHQLLSGLLDFEPASNMKKLTNLSMRCDNCGLTYSQFSKLGRFGCSSCYKNFSDRLDPLFKRIHGSTIHVGKVPKRSGGVMKHKREVETLKKEMMYRIEHEDFEQAAHIRDKIREIERKIIDQA
jgi:protein arginine kinase activator